MGLLGADSNVSEMSLLSEKRGGGSNLRARKIKTEKKFEKISVKNVSE